jgi:hypothetical protein
MPLRARGAMALGSMTGLSPDCQWLRTLIQLVTMVCAYESSRRFFVSDPEGLEVRYYVSAPRTTTSNAQTANTNFEELRQQHAEHSRQENIFL